MRAERDGNGPLRLAVGHRAQVGAHGARRVDQARSKLYKQPFQGVGVVARPNLGEVSQYARVEAPAAAGAAFPQDVREGGGEVGKDAVEAEHVGVVGAWAGELVHAAVVVPFDVADGGGAQDGGDGGDDEVLHGREGDVEYELVASEGIGVGAS